MRLLIFVFLMILSPSLLAANIDSPNSSTNSQMLQWSEEFQLKAAKYAEMKRENLQTRLSDIQEKDLEELRLIALKLTSCRDSNAIVLQLLQKYQDHDGLAREQLYSAILSGRSYTKDDMQFLKSAFLFSLSAKETPSFAPHSLALDGRQFRGFLAFQINLILGHPLDDPDRKFLSSDPKAWIEKKIP